MSRIRQIVIENEDGTLVSATDPLPASVIELASGISSNIGAQLNTTEFHVDGTAGALITGIDYVAGKSGIDASTETLQMIEYEHHEIHSGSHFSYTQSSSDWDIADPVEILLTTPASLKYVHLIWEFNASLNTTVTFYETSTHTAGAALTAFNNNRVVATAPTLVLNVSADDNADGTEIYTADFGISAGGGATRISGGGASRGSREWVLAPNKKYLFRALSGSDTSSYSLHFSWYEHTDKN